MGACIKTNFANRQTIDKSKEAGNEGLRWVCIDIRAINLDLIGYKNW